MIQCCEILKEFFKEKEHCLNISTVAQEEGKCFKLKNSQNACCLRVDGCWIDSNDQKKCDFIMFCCKSRNVHFIEFKGKNDHNEAVEQIINTYKKLKEHIPSFFFKEQAYQFSGIVIVSRVPTPKTDTGFARMQDKAMRECKLKIERKSQTYEV